MKNRSRIVVSLVCCALLSLALATPAPAEEKATREECIAKCKEVVALVEKIGLEAAFAKISVENGSFRWKDSYVVVIEEETGKLLAHALYPQAVGSPIKFATDADGVLIIQEMMKISETKGEGWFSYKYAKPNEQEALPKTAYILRIPGKKMFVSAGYYE